MPCPPLLIPERLNRVRRGCLERAKAEGDLAPESNPTALARYIATVTQGMAVQAAGGPARPAVVDGAQGSFEGMAGQREPRPG